VGGPMSTNSRAYTNAYQKRHYAANKAKYIAKADRWKKRKRGWLAGLKEGKPCVDCEIIYPAYVLDWDHARGEKRFLISRAIAAGKSYEDIQSELVKCDLVCANCHRVRTHNRRTSLKVE